MSTSRAAMSSLPYTDEMSAVEEQDSSARTRVAAVSEQVSLWLLIAVLAWAQFPLGSNRPWAWSLLAILVALVWLAWLPAAIVKRREIARAATRLAAPGMALIFILGWVFLQAAPLTPTGWHNAIWGVVKDGTGRTVLGAVSMNPFATVTEAMKLTIYLCAGWLAYALSRSHLHARRIFVAIAVIGVAYAVYGMFLSAIGSGQTSVLDGLEPPFGRDVTGGFVSKNNFATFDGICLAVCLLLLSETSGAVVVTRGFRHLGMSLVQFLFGRGVFLVLGSIALFVALVLADSRAGMLSTLGGLLVLFAFGILIAARRGVARWAFGAAAATLVTMLVLFSVSGDTIQTRFDELVETRSQEDLRPIMWNAALHAIADYPLLGSGLGTFRDSYNLYADHFEPYIVDKAHNDYLELALGLGVPMAVLWVSALVWLMVMCARGALRRRRRRVYALGAVSAATIVGLHSLVDFSLQMPAVALLFAVVMGVGLGQSERRAQRAGSATAVSAPTMSS